QLLLERQAVPPAGSVRRLRAAFVLRSWWRRWGAGQPDAGLGDAGEVLVELHEIQHVALDLASKTHKALLLRVDREAGSAFFVERAQSLEHAWSSTTQLDSDSLHHLEQRIRLLHRAEVVRCLVQ